MKKKIYTIIVTHNAVTWINNCLESILGSFQPTEIIVIDNCSTDSTVEIIKTKYTNVELIVSNKNIGFGNANNIGIKKAYEAGADYVFLLNQDAWIKANTIEELIKVAEQYKEYGVISPIHLNGEGNVLDYGFSNYIAPSKCKGFYSDVFLENKNKRLYEIGFVNAAAWLISRNCLEKVGGFNPAFFHYGEDNNYCQRVLFHQLKIGVYKDAFIYHDRAQRPKSNYFTDEFLFFERQIIEDFSNPFKNRKKRKYYKEEILNLYISIVTFNLKQFKKGTKRLKILNSIPFKNIKKYKESTLIGGECFLNQNSNI
jgi:GT2 family glycosyltransferase